MTNDPAEDLNQRARGRLGKVLHDKWRIDGLLGVGGMAVVYSATHVNNGRRVAIKLLHSELSVNPEVKTRFLREGYLANKVEHPGAVGVLDDDTAEDGSVFLVMELLEGETLEARRSRAGHALPVHEVLSLADRLLDVLAVAHEKGIVHRDIKPENIFLTREGTVKVLDFGIARMRELQGARLTLSSAGALGTPAFMPQEQARGRWEQVGPQSDIWAVGATMFTLVAGRLVHQAETVNELMLAAMTYAAPPVASVVPGISPAVASLIDRALAYEPGARWANARAMQSALRQAYQAMEQQHSLSGAFNLAGMQMSSKSAAAARAAGVLPAGPASRGSPAGGGMSAPNPGAPMPSPNPGAGYLPNPGAPMSAPNPVVAAGYSAPQMSAPMAVAPYPSAPLSMQSPGVAPPVKGAPAMMTGGGMTVVGGAVPARKGGQAPVAAIIVGMAAAVLCGIGLWALVLRGSGGPAPDATGSAQGASSSAPSATPSATPAASSAPSATPSAAPAPSGEAEAPAASASASADPSSKPGKTTKTPLKVPRKVPPRR